MACKGLIPLGGRICPLCGKDKSAHQQKHGGRKAKPELPLTVARPETDDEFADRMYRELSINRNYHNYKG